MDKDITYHPLFHCDVMEAANWYDRRSAGLGDAFATNVKSTVAEIIDDPDRFAATPMGLRYLRVERFPYLVLFDVTEEQVCFLGVLHTARSIEKWRDKRR